MDAIWHIIAHVILFRIPHDLQIVMLLYNVAASERTSCNWLIVQYQLISDRGIIEPAVMFCYETSGADIGLLK